MSVAPSGGNKLGIVTTAHCLAVANTAERLPSKSFHIALSVFLTVLI